MPQEKRPPVTKSAIAALAILIVAAAAGFAFMVKQSAERLRTEEIARPAVVELGGSFVRTLAEGGRFEIKVSLEADPAREDREQLLDGIESRRAVLRSIVYDEVLSRTREEDFRRGPSLVETLKLQIQDRINRELQADGLGASAIRRVIVEDLVAPPAAK